MHRVMRVPTQAEMVQQAEQRTQQERLQRELGERRAQKLAKSACSNLGFEP